MAIKLYWSARTRSSRAVWMLHEADVAYDIVEVDIRDEQSKADSAFRKASPMGKVPAIADGEACMSDSAAICIYLADKYALSRLAPKLDDPLRAKYLYWMIFVPGVLEPAMGEKVAGHETNPLSHGWGDFDSMIATLEKALQPGPWLLGKWFTAADVMVGSSVVFLKLFNLLPESTVLEQYAQRCLEREAYQRALALEPAND